MFTMLQKTHIVLEGRQFDSHVFINKFAELYPAYYINLVNLKGAQQAHAEIAKAYSQSGIGNKVIESGISVKVKSKNINGYSSPCQLWCK